MAHTNYINYVHTSSGRKYEEELCLNEPTIVFLCNNCTSNSNIYPTSFMGPKEFPTLSFNSIISNNKILNQDEQQTLNKKSCISKILATSKSISINVNSDENNKDLFDDSKLNQSMSFILDEEKNIKSNYTFSSSRNELFHDNFAIDKFTAYAVIHPYVSNERNIKIKSIASRFLIVSVNKFRGELQKNTLISLTSLLHIIFNKPSVSNDIVLEINSLSENKYGVCIISNSMDDFYIKKNNKYISSNDLTFIKSQDLIAELGAIINHIPGVITKTDACIKNLESPSCINYRKLHVLQLYNPILNNLIMQCRFLYVSGNIFIPNDENVPNIIFQSIIGNKLIKLKNEQYMKIINFNSKILGIQKPVCNISINDNSINTLWSIFMFFNHPDEGNKESVITPIILKSEKSKSFLMHNLSAHQVYILPNTRRSIYAYLKDNQETLRDAFHKITTSKINQLSQDKLFFFYQRFTSDVIITVIKDDELLKNRIICLLCNTIFPRELSNYTDSIRSETINSTNNMLSLIYENKYSPFILTNKQKISFK